jgi:hypothetical protein
MVVNPEKATLLMHTEKPVIDPEIVLFADKNGYTEKPEFHLSIISFQNGKKIIDNYKNDPEIIQKIQLLVDSFNWDISLSSEYFLIEKYYDEIELEKSGYKNVPNHTRRTIIQKANITDIVSFYEKLSKLTNIVFEVPFSHLTLFCWSDYLPMMTQGIGLYSENDFKKYLQRSL